MSRVTATVFVCFFAFLAGCASFDPNMPGTARASASFRISDGTGAVSIRVHIPDRVSGRVANSWATKGITFAFDPAIGNRSFALVRANRTQCSGLPLVCTISIALAPGTYRPQMTTYSLPAIGGVPEGRILTSAPLLFTVTRGATAQFDLVLGGDRLVFPIPPGVNRIGITAGGAGSAGGLVRATIPVHLGEALTIFAGGAPRALQGGFNGGGDSVRPSDPAQAIAGTGGGGASDVRLGGATLAA
jgi:hypothetical protein